MYYQKKNNFFAENRELLQSSLFALACVLLFLAFPLAGTVQGITALFALLVVTPILYTKIILNAGLDSIGVSWGDKKAGALWGGLMLIASLFFAFVITKTSFAGVFALPIGVQTDFSLFLTYELILANFVLFALEFFFHGFVISIFSTRFKNWAIIFSALLFIIFLLLTNNARWEVIALTGAVVAYKSRSFFYSYLMSLLFMIFFDSYLIFISK